MSASFSNSWVNQFQGIFTFLFLARFHNIPSQTRNCPWSRWCHSQRWARHKVQNQEQKLFCYSYILGLCNSMLYWIQKSCLFEPSVILLCIFSLHGKIRIFSQKSQRQVTQVKLFFHYNIVWEETQEFRFFQTNS